MTNFSTKKISVIIENELLLEKVINELMAKAVARHNINLQGSPEQLEEAYGKAYIPPAKIRAKKSSPKAELFLEDDFGWVQGFTYALPIFICTVIAVFFIGDVRDSPIANIFWGISGMLVGGIIGAFLTQYVKYVHLKRISKQENKGGYVLWITALNETELENILAVLKSHHLTNIKTSDDLAQE